MDLIKVNQPFENPLAQVSALLKLGAYMLLSDCSEKESAREVQPCSIPLPAHFCFFSRMGLRDWNWQVTDKGLSPACLLLILSDHDSWSQQKQDDYGKTLCI